MKISLIASPYDLGREGEGMGAGPIRYLESGVEHALADRGFEVEVDTVERGEPFGDEFSAVADVNADLTGRVRDAVERGAFPLVLAGNCDSALGTLAGIGTADVGIFWLDAHGDFNTPGTSPSGYLAGMVLATATGRCHEELWSSVGNGGPSVPEPLVVAAGIRDLDPDEGQGLESSEVRAVAASEINASGVEESLRAPLEDLRLRVDEVYLHLDIDSLDPRHAPGVDFPAPGGLSVEDVEEAIRMVAQRFSIKAAALTAYNPQRDEDDRTLRAGMRLIGTLSDAATDSREAKHGRP